MRFFAEGSRRLKLIRAGFKGQGAESAGRLFSTWCSSTCRSTRKLRDLKSPAPIPDQGMFCASLPKISTILEDRDPVFFVLDPVGTFQKLRVEDLGVFRPNCYLSFFLLAIVFLLSFSRNPPGICQNKKLLHAFNPKPILSLAPGVGFEPTRA